MPLLSILLTAADPSILGRVDKASLSTQALMEIFIEGIENREIISGCAEEPNDFDKWNGFEYVEEQPADAAVKLINIYWVELGLAGTIDLQWLPPAIRSLSIRDNELSGSLNLTALPPSIQLLECRSNGFSGEIDLCRLPAEIEDLYLSINHLS